MLSLFVHMSVRCYFADAYFISFYNLRFIFSYDNEEHRLVTDYISNHYINGVAGHDNNYHRIVLVYHYPNYIITIIIIIVIST